MSAYFTCVSSAISVHVLDQKLNPNFNKLYVVAYVVPLGTF